MLNQQLDKQPFESGPMPRKAGVLRGMMEEMGLVDVWRQKHPKERDYRFFSKVHGSYSRIDMLCMLKGDVYKATSCHIESISISDHAPLVLSLVLDESCSLKQWRLHFSLLNNLSGVQKIKLEWKDYLDHNDNGEVSASTL